MSERRDIKEHRKPCLCNKKIMEDQRTILLIQDKKEGSHRPIIVQRGY